MGVSWHSFSTWLRKFMDGMYSRGGFSPSTKKRRSPDSANGVAWPLRMSMKISWQRLSAAVAARSSSRNLESMAVVLMVPRTARGSWDTRLTD
jgi:hypothetical protein